MTDSKDNILITALDDRWEVYHLRYKACRREFSEEAVHDLRVAARRLLSVLDIVRDVMPELRVQKTRRVIKDQLDELDTLHDVQVMLRQFLATHPKVPEVETLEPYLEEMRTALMRSAKRHMQLARLLGLKRRLDRVRVVLAQHGVDEVPPDLLLQAVDNAYARAMQADEQIDARKLPTIHRARIEFKKFRYMSEIVFPLLPTPEPDYLTRMHDYQGAMGDIRDVTVLIDTLSKFSRETDRAFDIRPIRRYFRKYLTQLVLIFMQQKAELHSFWRASDAEPFPWETSQGGRRPAVRTRIPRPRQKSRKSTSSGRSAPGSAEPERHSATIESASASVTGASLHPSSTADRAGKETGNGSHRNEF